MVQRYPPHWPSRLAKPFGEDSGKNRLEFSREGPGRSSSGTQSLPGSLVYSVHTVFQHAGFEPREGHM